ncbi:MAG: hypothetical protein RL397_1407 [Pseudomonadota bacterium]|jgi:Na+/melibiose symporter-like transporter
MNKGVAWAYAAPGFAVAFAALPLYLLTPQLYAGSLGLPLAAVGLVLMATRLVDAITDPLIGRLIDRTSGARFRRWMVPALVLLAASFVALVLPPAHWVADKNTEALLFWMGGTALLVSLSNSAAILAHQSWAIAQASDPAEQRTWIAARETIGLAGLILAAGLAAQQMTLAMATVLVVATAVSLWAVRRVPCGDLKPPPQEVARPAALPLAALFHQAYVRLLGALGVNALANAIPATLFLFFVADKLGLSAEWSAALLVVYFVSAALSIGFWSRLIARLGPRRTWQIAMTLSILAFSGAVFLGPGQAAAFGLICVFTGVALGAELTCPSLLIGQLIAARGHQGQAEGQYFGYWSLLNKLALALAAGLSLPLLQAFGYVPGSPSEPPLALQLTYAAIPCGLKLLALMILPETPATASAPPQPTPLPNKGVPL